MKSGGQKAVGAGKSPVDTVAREAARIFTEATKGLVPKAVSTVSNPPTGFSHADAGFKRFSSVGGVNASRFAAKAAEAAQDRALVLAEQITKVPLPLACNILAQLIKHYRKS